MHVGMPRCTAPVGKQQLTSDLVDKSALVSEGR